MISARAGLRIGTRLGTTGGPGEDPIDGGGGGPPPVNTTLTVAINDSVDPAISHVNIDYSVVVTNTGAVDATSVTAVITLDATLTYVSSSGTGWSTGAVGQVVTCTRATLAAGAAPTITVTVTTADAASTESSTADASAANAPAATQDVETTVVKLVDRDATSGIRVPSSLTQWQDFNAYHVAIGTASFPNVAPSLLWLMQETSGNLADSIGTFTGTASGAPLTYSTAVAGWSRLGIVGADAGTGAIDSTAAGLPDPAAASMTTIQYELIQAAPAANRNLFAMGTANLTTSLVTTTPRYRGSSGANTATGTVDPTGAVRPNVMLYDFTAARVAFANDLEILAPTKAGTTGKRHRLNFTSSSVKVYLVTFFNAAAELSNNGLRALLTALGFTIAW